MEQLLRETREDVAYIKAKIEGLPCSTHTQDIKDINKKVAFASGAWAAVAFIITKVIGG